MAQPNATPRNDSGSAPASNEPDFVFVRNTTAGFRTLLGNPKADVKLASPRFVCSPGLAIVARVAWEQNTRNSEGVEVESMVDDLERFGLVKIDPTRVSNSEAIMLARTCGARNALQRWRAIEKREAVLVAINHRIANPGKAKADSKAA